MKKFEILLIVSVVVTSVVRGTPFDDLDEYIESYQEKIKDLLNLGPRYAPEEINLEDRGHFNSSGAVETGEFDFIIVGAGAAGSVLANRLSEIPEWKILLIEAGGYEDEITRIPGYVLDLLGTKYNWGYKTIPQKSWCYSEPDKKCPIEMGKALGGSTVINGMLYTRGNPKDYDHWADLGNKGWCWDDVFPYFKKIEDARLKDLDAKFHRYGGKVHIENSQDDSPLTGPILKAAYELRIPYVDYNGKEQMGIGFSQGTTKHGQRWSAYKGYLEEAKTRPNLIIKPHSFVTEIMIEPNMKEAYGVKFIQNDQFYIAKAKKEVILSAGALNTPQLLQVSGIGPKEHLEKLGIDNIADLKVGMPLRTHLGFPGLKFIFNETKALKRDEKEDLIRYLKEGKGPLAAMFTDVVAYLKTEISKDKGNYPDVEVLFVPYVHKPEEIYTAPKEKLDETDKFEGHHAISITIVLMRPKSYGSIKIVCKDLKEVPEIDLNHLSDKDDFDIDTLLAGTRLVQKFLKTQSFKKLGAYLDPTIVPECQNYKFDSDLYWKCAIRYLSYSLRHPVGTAKMGPPQDKNAVVDNHLNVYGVRNLRVVDNSIVPVSITGHMMAPAYMIGEKAADLIKEFWSWRV